jgi:hypothetical protein
MDGWKLNMVEPTPNSSGYTALIASLIAFFTMLRGNIGDDTTLVPEA